MWKCLMGSETSGRVWLTNGGRGWTERMGGAHLRIQANRLHWIYTNSRLSLESEFSE